MTIYKYLDGLITLSFLFQFLKISQYQNAFPVFKIFYYIHLQANSFILPHSFYF